MSMKEFYEQEFTYNVFGVVTGTASASQFPDIDSSLVTLKARSGNLGSFLIGNETGTVVGLPYEIDAGDSEGWFPISNLNKLWHTNPSGTSDLLSFWIQR